MPSRHIVTNYILLLHPVPHCPVLGLGRHAVYTLSTQPSQSSSPVPHCPVLPNQAPMTCHCAATEYTALFTQGIPHELMPILKLKMRA